MVRLHCVTSLRLRPLALVPDTSHGFQCGVSHIKKTHIPSVNWHSASFHVSFGCAACNLWSDLPMRRAPAWRRTWSSRYYRPCPRAVRHTPVTVSRLPVWRILKYWIEMARMNTLILFLNLVGENVVKCLLFHYRNNTMVFPRVLTWWIKLVESRAPSILHFWDKTPRLWCVAAEHRCLARLGSSSLLAGCDRFVTRLFVRETGLWFVFCVRFLSGFVLVFS